MKVLLAVATAALCVAGSTLAQQLSAPGTGVAAGVELKDLRQKASYGYGYNLGRNLKCRPRRSILSS